MKKSKLLIIILLCTLTLFLVTGCQSKNDSFSGESKLKAKCSALECIKKIKVDNTAFFLMLKHFSTLTNFNLEKRN